MTKTKKTPARKPGKAPADWTPRVAGDDYLTDFVRRTYEFGNGVDVKALVMADANLRETYYPTPRAKTTAQDQADTLRRDEASVRGFFRNRGVDAPEFPGVTTVPPPTPKPDRKLVRAAKALLLPAGPRTAVGRVLQAVRTPAAPPAKAPRKVGSCAFAAALVKAGEGDADKVVAAVRAEFPQSTFSRSDVGIIRRKVAQGKY